MEKVKRYIKRFFVYINGNKTYIVTVISASYTVLETFGLVSLTEKQETALHGLLLALFGAAIRHAVQKMTKK